MKACPGLEVLDNATLAELFWIGKERKLARGKVLYKQDEALDGSFCLLLDGRFGVWIDGASVAELSAPTLIGESAFATVEHKRGATVRATSEWTTVLEFRPSEELIAGPLSKLFSEFAWDRWLTITRLHPS